MSAPCSDCKDFRVCSSKSYRDCAFNGYPNFTHKEQPVTQPLAINQTLDQRGARYGEFKDQAVIAENLNVAMTNAPGWQRLAPDQKEALRIIQNKVARILNGDPNYSDSWHDIAGYATLVDNRLKGEGL